MKSDGFYWVIPNNGTVAGNGRQPAFVRRLTAPGKKMGVTQVWLVGWDIPCRLDEVELLEKLEP